MRKKDDGKTPSRWHTLRLNLPSGRSYTSYNPWVSKVRKDGNLESEVFIYVHAVRSLGY